MLFVVCLFGSINASAASYTTYTYSYTKKYQASPDAFAVKERLTDFGGSTLNNPASVCADDNGNIYISDTGNNRIVVLDSDYRFKYSIDSFIGLDGKEQSFKAPTGIFVDGNSYLYVADKDNKQIEIFKDGLLDRIIPEPVSARMNSDYSYIPVAVCADKLGRIYVLSRDTAGVILMDKNGAFQGYIGAQSVSVNLTDYLWRSFMTKEQLRKSQQYVPMNYNNINIDKDGFLYVTSYIEDSYALMQAVNSGSTTDTTAPVKKLTSSGVDVLKRNGFFPPVGDVNFDVNATSKKGKPQSNIGAVTVRKNGIYSIADLTYGKIFSYDENGNLLYAFGGLGDEEGLFEKLTSIAYNDTELLALDSAKNSLTVYSITEYGKLLDKVIELQNQNKYSQTVDVWKEILVENNNFDLAYNGIAKVYYENGDYDNAMLYYKAINNKEGYSKAFEKKRENFLNKYFLFVPVLIVAVIFLIAKLFSCAKKYNKKHRPGGRKRSIREQIVYAFYYIFHPFDGANDLKFESRGSVISATVILISAIVTIVLNSLATGYLFKDNSAGQANGVLSALANVMVPFCLFCIANWCLTSLMDGEGSMKNIYIVSSYSLIPVIILLLPATIISHFLVLSESTVLSFMVNIAYMWAILLIFFGTMTVHNYGLGKQVVVTVLSIVGIAIILFLILLFVSVIGRISTFIVNIYNEISFRF